MRQICVNLYRIWSTYNRLALCMRTGSSALEYTLPSSVQDDKGEFEKDVMLQAPVADHALNYVILETGVSLINNVELYLL